MYFQGMLSSMAVGSDLYMILTGYLCFNKVLGKVFYKGGLKVILSYIFFSLLTIVANVNLFHTGMNWKSGLLGILSFSTIPYAWYIEMWIGLFILVPFLNIWYKALESRKQKRQLIIVLLALSAFPDFFNRYGMRIVPQFWEMIYPFAFYFVGCYLREYKPSYNKWKLLAVILLITMVSPIVTLVSGHETFIHFIGDRNGIFMATIAICIFAMFYNVDIKHTSIRYIFKAISLRSLDIFLCSAIMDFYLYPLFKSHFFINQSQFGAYYFVIVPLIFIICFTLASIKRIIFSVAQRVISLSGSDILIQNR